MDNVKCFWIEPSGTLKVRLRRYVGFDESRCSVGGYHNAHSEEVERRPHTAGTYISQGGPEVFERYPKTDPRWPTRCACGYAFQDSDAWQEFVDQIYVDKKGREYLLRDNVPGMMYDAWWLHDTQYVGADGRSIMVVCPDGHEWCIDSRASNCDMKKDTEHKCWIRHGEPPMLTVDKNGKTCGAGAGSIQTPKWHGFLVNGKFVLNR
jgi:hypothetical protein